MKLKLETGACSGLWILMLGVGCSVTVNEGDTDVQPSRSGLSSQARLSMLTSEEQTQLCSWAESQPGFGQAIDCGGGTVTVEAGPPCSGGAIPAACTATVSQAEDCLLANIEDPCTLVVTACLPVLECIESGGDFMCADGNGTAPAAFVCDGDPDCADGSDEQGC
ncbi:MAG: LDL receptor domain-containing protein [Myxococcales bacterium]|nr:LDL receptor domain-containing protein [Myxococcales bacterium]MDD9966341.1 LDL receptor domain-containing protein [Myxococcales bacterium]